MVEGLKRRLWVILGFLFLVGGISVYGYWQKTNVSENVSYRERVEVAEGAKPGSSEAVIYVTGAVLHPGVIHIPAGGRVIDAVNAAGGLAPGADTGKVNLAKQVKDGMQINIPGVAGSSAAPRSTGGAAADAGEKININTADPAQLDKLPGVGPALAQRIIDYRAANGPFRDPADLKKVSGIGDAKFNQLKDKITL